MPGEECYTDYQLVCFKLSFHFKPKPKKDVTPMRKLEGSQPPEYQGQGRLSGEPAV